MRVLYRVFAVNGTLQMVELPVIGETTHTFSFKERCPANNGLLQVGKRQMDSIGFATTPEYAIRLHVASRKRYISKAQHQIEKYEREITQTLCLL